MRKNNSLHWELDDKGVLAVSVKGHMPDFFDEKKEAPWQDVKDRIETIVFREGILSIGQQAFKDCKSLAYVEIPESLERIGYAAFEGCTSLDCVDFPDHRALKHRRNPNQDVRLSEKKVVMERKAFLYTPWAKEEFGDMLREGSLLLEYYGDEKEVEIPEGIEKIDNFAFCGYPIEAVKLPESLKVIGEFAFEETKLKKVFIPEGVEKLETGAFSKVPTLEWVYFVSPDTQIHPLAFEGSKENLVLGGHNPSEAKRFCGKYDFTFQTNHRVVKRFKKISMANGEVDSQYIMRRMNQRYAVLALLVNDRTKTVEMIKSHRIKMFPIYGEDYFLYYGESGAKMRMMAEYVIYPRNGLSETKTWYYTVNKDSVYSAYAGEAYYKLAIMGQEKSMEDCHYEWYLSWEVNKWNDKLELIFLNDWMKNHPEYKLPDGGQLQDGFAGAEKPL